MEITDFTNSLDSEVIKIFLQVTFFTTKHHNFWQIFSFVLLPRKSLYSEFWSYDLSQVTSNTIYLICQT